MMIYKGTDKKYTPCLICFPATVTNTVTKRNIGEDRVYLACRVQFFKKRIQGRNSKQDPGGRN